MHRQRHLAHETPCCVVYVRSILYGFVSSHGHARGRMRAFDDLPRIISRVCVRMRVLSQLYSCPKLHCCAKNRVFSLELGKLCDCYFSSGREVTSFVTFFYYLTPVNVRAAQVNLILTLFFVSFHKEKKLRDVFPRGKVNYERRNFVWRRSWNSIA